MTENNKTKVKVVEETGQKYNEIIYEEDYIPKNVYMHQIDLRNNIIDQSLSGKKFEYVVDLGCGTGFHLNTLNKYAQNLIGCDMSFGALKESKKHLKCEYIVCDVNALPFKPETLDLIWIAGVLHHVPDDLENVVGNNISSVLKKNGLLLIDEPNKFNLFNYLNMKLSKADPTGDERPLSLYFIKRLLGNNNFKVLGSDPYELFSPFGALLKSTFILKLASFIDKLLSKTPIKLIFLRWYILAEKK